MSSPHGYTLIEILFVAALMTTIAAIATPGVLVTIDEYRAFGAVRYISARLYDTRMEAVARNADAAMRFVQVGQSYAYAAYIDGNGNGVRARDIQRGTDRVIHAEETLPNHFTGVEFGAVAGLPAVDPPAPPPGNDPIRLGAGNMVTFTPQGTSTAGSLYIRSHRDTQYVIRIFGDTGKIRILKFNPQTGEWERL
jgi:prepilin-type N-terminal cleavage/methylation domain-containing protein